jgi:hypothetical protein
LTTVAAAGDITAGGAVSFGAAKNGALSLAGDIDTSDDNVTFARAVTLGGDVDIDTTGAAAGNILFSGMINAAGHALVLDAGGAGNITLSGALAGNGALTVRSGAMQSYQVLTVDTLDIQNATFSVLFNAGISADTSLAVNSSGTIGINGTINAGGTIDINADGLTTVGSGGDITAEGAVTFGASKAGGVSLSADVTTLGAPIAFVRPVSLGASVVLDTHATTGVADISLSAVTANGFDILLDTGHVSGADMTLTSVSGVGSLTIRDVGTLNVSGQIDADTGVVVTSAVDLLDFAGSLTTPALTLPVMVTNYDLHLTGAAVSIEDSMVFTNTGALVLGRSAGTLSFEGGLTALTSLSLELNGQINTQGSLVNLSRNILLGSDVIIDTGNSATGTINLGDVSSAGHRLTLDSGSNAGATINMGSMSDLGGGLVVVDAGGLVTLGALGQTVTGNILISQTRAGMNFSGAVNANTLEVTDTADAQTVLFSGDTSISNLLTGAQPYNLAFSGDSTVISGHTVFNNAGLLVLGADSSSSVVFSNGVDTTGVASTRIAGLLETVDSPMVLGSVIMNDASVLRSGTGTMDVQSISDEGNAYTLTIGSAAQTGAVAFSGDVAIDALVLSGGAYQVSLLGAANEIEQLLIFNNTAGVILGDSQNDSFLFSSGVTALSSAVTLFGQLMTNASAVTLGAVSLAGDSLVDTTNGGVSASGANISAVSLDGSSALVLDAGLSGNITFAGDIGSVLPLTSLTIMNSNDMYLGNVTLTGALTQLTGQGTTSLNAAVLTGGAVELRTGAIAFTGQGYINANSRGADVSLFALSGMITSGEALTDITARMLTLDAFSGIGTADNPLLIDAMDLRLFQAGAYLRIGGDLIVASIYLNEGGEISVNGSILDDEDSGGMDFISDGDVILRTTYGVIGTAMNPLEVGIAGQLILSPGGVSGLFSAVISGRTQGQRVYIRNLPTGFVLFNNRIFAGPVDLVSGYSQSLAVPEQGRAGVMNVPEVFGQLLSGPAFFYFGAMNDLVADF